MYKFITEIKRFYILFLICFTLFSTLAVSSISSAQITDPIPEKIEKSNLSVELKEVVQIPISGTGSNRVARLNFLTHAGDGSGRLFVNDMRGKLYVIINGKFYVYIDLKEIVGSGFSDETSQQGFTYFAFHPKFAKNGIFYTVNSEEKKILLLIF